MLKEVEVVNLNYDHGTSLFYAICTTLIARMEATVFCLMM